MTHIRLWNQGDSLAARAWVMRTILALLIAALPTAGLTAQFTLRIGAGHPSKPSPYIWAAETLFIPAVQKRVREETDHSIQFITVFGGSVAKPFEILEATQKSVFDIGLAIPAFEQSRMPLLTFSFRFPFTSPDIELQQRVAMRMVQEVPELNQSLERFSVELLALTASENYGVGSTFDWDKLEELKGRRFAVAGTNATWAKPVGAIPLQISISDNYTGLQTGLLDGNFVFLSSFANFRFHEVAKFYTHTDFGAPIGMAMLMSQKTIDRLPEEVVKIIREEAATSWSRGSVEIAKTRLTALQDDFERERLNIKHLSVSQRQEWARMLEHLPSQAAQELDGLGLPGTKVFRAYKQMVQEEGYQFPADYPL